MSATGGGGGARVFGWVGGAEGVAISQLLTIAADEGGQANGDHLAGVIREQPIAHKKPAFSITNKVSKNADVNQSCSHNTPLIIMTL